MGSWTTRMGTTIAGGSLLLGFVAVPAVASSPAAPAVAHLAASVKIGSAGAVVIDPSSIAAGIVVVSTEPVAGLSGATVQLAARGDARLTSGTTPSSVPAGVSSTEAGVAVTESGPTDPAAAAVADATGSTVTATLTGTTPDGEVRTASDTVWVDQIAGTTVVSERGEQDLRLQRVDALVAAGELSASAAAAARKTILGSTGSTTTVTEDVCAGVCVNGTVLWTDRNGATHPVDRASVQIRDEEPGVDQIVATVRTNSSGSYASVVDNNDGDATGRDIYVRVLADGPGFRVNQHIDSAVTNNAVTGTVVSKNLTANNIDDNNTAFSVQAALVIGNDEVVSQNGSLLDTIPVIFPSDGSYYDGTALNLLELDRWDWDVTLHEFGHHVSSQLNIERDPGGSHFDTNLSNIYGKDKGTRLAWGEGWPTYFAVSTLHERAAGLGVPNVGDTDYQDTEDADIDDNLELTHTTGEDNEVTVMAALWDLYDSVADTRDTISLGTAAIWDTLDAGDPETLSDAYQLVSPGGSSDGTNCIFSQQNVSPRISGATTTVTNAQPTFRWRAGNGGDFPNNRFQVKFRSAGGTLLLTSPTVRSNSFTPSRAQWDTVLAGAGGTVKVAVVGRQVNTPLTGPYRSCLRSYTVD